LLDSIELQNGARQATYCLQVFSSLANWHAARDDNYRSPLVKGMRRGAPTKRERILSDHELRAVWSAAESNGTYGALIRLALLTAQRQDKLASMKWADVSDVVWTIATQEREKGNAGTLVLPQEAVAIIEAQPRSDSPYVFPASGTRRGRGYVSGWSQMKRNFDRKVTIADWTFHDLRRSARSLMARAGVRPDIAERVMGHAIAGVEGVYDRHSYLQERGEALQRLAALLMSIVTPPPDNVVHLQAAAS
jgi:integrase